MGSTLTKEEWITFHVGSPIPENALIASTSKNGNIFIGRSFIPGKGYVMVAYYEAKKKAVAYIRDNKPEEIFSSFEILTGSGHVWLNTTNFQIPQGAVAVGVNSAGQNLYVGRGKGIDMSDNKTHHFCLVTINPSIKSTKALDGDRNLRLMNLNTQILVEAPKELKFFGPELFEFPEGASNSNVTIEKFIIDFLKSGNGMMIHYAKYYAKRSSNSAREGLDDDKKCCICFVTDKDTIFMPCNHVRCCFECAEEIKTINGRCPVCREPITKVEKIFL